MYVWLFVIGGIVGFVLETLFCIFVHHRMEFRGGLLYLPINPVYGVGTVLLTLVLGKLPVRHPLVYFGVSMLLGGAYEYACSYCQEKVFGTVSWQYAGSVGSIGGRTSVPFAICWGLFGMIWMVWGYSYVKRWAIGTALVWIMGTILLMDMILSAMAESRHNQRRQGAVTGGRISGWLDRHFPDEVMERVYPNAIAVVPKAKS